MKFQSLFDIKYFIKSIECDIIDEAFRLKLKASVNNEIPDKDYFLLSDTIDSYIGELKLHSEGKTFFKSLQQEKLTDVSVKNLFAFLTHLSIGLNDRKKIRKSVDLKSFNELKDIAWSMVNELLDHKEIENKLYYLLK